MPGSAGDEGDGVVSGSADRFPWWSAVAMADLLIGGAGFIGAYVARQLLDAGEDVAVYDRDVRHGPIVDLLRPDELARLTLLPGDVADAVHLMRTIAELRPRRIVQLAAMLTPAGQADPATA